MRRFPMLVLVGLMGMVAFTLPATAQEGPGGPPAEGGAGGPRGFHILPPFVMDKLNLTDDQRQQLAALEKETKAKLDKILTDEQKKTLAEARPPRPPQQGGPGGGGPDDGGPGGDGGPR